MQSRSSNETERFRHECEVRWLLRKFCAEGKEALNRYVGLVREKRGDWMADRLLADTRAQYALGNRGFDGEWRA